MKQHTGCVLWLTGVQFPYEPPQKPELILDTSKLSLPYYQGIFFKISIIDLLRSARWAV